MKKNLLFFYESLKRGLENNFPPSRSDGMIVAVVL
jgi:hypothetical protein